ncbi:MAG: hypothetical protein ACM3IL_02200 [Deltaproteobacteria bacterium]
MKDLFSDKKWTIFSYLIIFFLFSMLVLRWPLLPNFMDIYYHLAVAQGFAKAGGFSAHDFWSYAPYGRAHLYPPAFHFLTLALIKTGLPVLGVARLLDVVTFPLFLLSIWLFMRLLFNARLAFFSVLLSSSLYSFYLASSNFMPVTYAFIFGLLSLLCLEKDKVLSAGLFLGLCFYTHAQIPWFFILTLAAYGLFDKSNLIRCLKSAILGILLSAPIIIYLFKNRNFYTPGMAHENFILEVNLYIFLSILGMRVVLKEKKRYGLLLSLAVAMVPFVFSYPYRYISGQGLVGAILLSAVGLDRLYAAGEKLFLRPGCGRIKESYPAVLIILFMLVSPEFLLRTGQGLKFTFFGSAYLNLAAIGKTADRPNDYSISSSKYVGKLIKIVRENSQDRDIIFSNLDFAGTLISALTGRADASGMLREVGPRADHEPIRDSRIVVWFKDPDGSPGKGMMQAVSGYSLKEIAQTDIAYIYRNDFAQSAEQIKRATIPSSIIIAAAFIIASLLVWDIFLRGANK